MNPASNQQRITGWQLLVIWFGGVISIPTLLIGNVLVLGLTLGQALLAALIGLLVVSAFMGLESVAAVEQRRPTVSLAARSFGDRGAEIIVGFCIGVASLGWFGIWCKLGGASVAPILHAQFDWQVSPAWPGALLGMLMVGTAAVGIAHLKLLNYVAVPCKVLLLIYAMWMSLSTHDLADLRTHQPPEPMDFITAVGLAIGSFAVGGVIAPDYARYATTRRAALIGSVLGFLPAAMSMTLIGCVLAILQKSTDLVQMFSSLSYPVLALSFLVIAVWPLNAMNAYSAGLAINQMLRLPDERRWLVTVVAGIAGIVLGVSGVLDNFVGFLTLLSALIPPVAGVIVAEYWFCGQRDVDAQSLPFRWTGLIAWAVGATGAWMLDTPMKTAGSVFVSGMLYVLFHRLQRRLSMGPGLESAPGGVDPGNE